MFISKKKYKELIQRIEQLEGGEQVESNKKTARNTERKKIIKLVNSNFRPNQYRIKLAYRQKFPCTSLYYGHKH